MDLSHHLKEFVRVFNVAGDISPQDMMLMHSAMLVAQHFEKKTCPEAFRAIIYEQNLQYCVTGTFICDFEHGEETALIKDATKYGGAWETKLQARETKLQDTRDPERNEFYAVFANPMDAYSFVRKATDVVTIS